MALLQVHYRSSVLGMATAMDVLLPERPCPHADGWQTLYLLHGYAGDHTVWQRRTAVERYVAGSGIAVVMPAAYNSFYNDLPYGGAYWTHISDELPTVCERMFPLSRRREDRYALGLSMGGYGALKLGLVLPNRYAAVASLSGAVDALLLMDQANIRPALADVYGSREALEGSDSDLFAAARRLVESGGPFPRIYLACGTEDFLLGHSRRFANAYGAPLRVTYEEGPGAHTWDFWDAYLKKALAWMMA